ncbi:hypothetical protein ACFWYW_57075 [Nonomuraea sp. NPDC059023]|uniref:hypothetical protein n=1 Tax=unclassified Nonomuraea TaxID=2593643 RepID=UPI0036834AED
MSDTLRVHLTVNLARSAARARDLELAVQLLDELDGADRDAADVLDLRARLHAQRGELQEADKCWARVQESAPDHAAAASGRRTIKRISDGGRLSRPLTRPGLLAAAAALVAVAGWAVAVLPADSEPRPALTRSGHERTESLTAERDALIQRLSSLTAERAAAADHERAADARRDRQVAALAKSLAMPGVIVQRRSGSVRVLFESRLFPRSTEIDRNGMALLRELGRKIAALDVRTTVVGHAVTVPGGRTKGGSVVALGRALVAARYLAEGGHLALTSFTLRSADQSATPRRRTVTLLVTPKGSRGDGT